MLHDQSVSRCKADLVPETLRGNYGNLIADTFVGLKVQGELGIVALYYDFGRFLDRFCSHTSLKV